MTATVPTSRPWASEHRLAEDVKRLKLARRHRAGTGVAAGACRRTHAQARRPQAVMLRVCLSDEAARFMGVENHVCEVQVRDPPRQPSFPFPKTDQV